MHYPSLIDHINVDEIADVIVYMLEHPEGTEKMCGNGRIGVKEKYNWGRMKKRLLGLYKGLGTCQQFRE